jgi:hypothetical protein
VDVKTAEEILPGEEKPNIGSVLDDLKERISSPFLFSFVLSFLVANWRIVIGLIFLDKEELKARGIIDKVDFVSQNLNNWDCILWPLTGAAIYCFFYPWLRDFIKVIQAEHLTKTNAKINKVARDYPVPMMKYISKVEELSSLKQAVSKLMMEEGQVKQENSKLTTEKVNLTTEIRKLEKEIQTWVQYSSPDVLNGNWDYSFSIDEPVMSIQINNSKVYRYINSQLVQIYDIKNFHGNPRNRSVIFQLIPVGNEFDRHTHALTIAEGFEYMEGMEDWAHPVLYKATLQL